MIRSRDILLFVVLTVVWGSAFVAIEVGLETLPPILFAALRLDVAALVFVIALVARGTPWRPRTRADWALLPVGAVLLVGTHYGLLFLGQSYVTSGVAAIVLSLVPIVTPALALALIPGLRVRAPGVVGLLLGLAGVVVIAGGSGSVGGRAVGVALLLASALSFALGSVLIERLLPGAALPILSLQAWSMAGGAVVLHAISAGHPGESPAGLEPTAEAALALGYLGIVATGGGFLVYFRLLDRVGATELSLVNYAVPVVAAIVGWAALGESITAGTVAGFLLIVLGFALYKIDVLWKSAAPLVGYGPHRSGSTESSGIVVDGNVYVSRRADGASPPQSAD